MCVFKISDVQILFSLFRKQFTNEFGESTNHILQQCTYSFNIGIGMPKDSPYHERYYNYTFFLFLKS